jgi:hypothetical protein
VGTCVPICAKPVAFMGGPFEISPSGAMFYPVQTNCSGDQRGTTRRTRTSADGTFACHFPPPIAELCIKERAADFLGHNAESKKLKRTACSRASS